MNLGPPTSFRIAKGGNRPEECEDAFRVCYSQEVSETLARAAISDGASGAAFAGEWASILVDTFVERPLDILGLSEEALHGWLSLGQEEWRLEVPWSLIPWHGEAKAKVGAFATLLGVTIKRVSDNTDRFQFETMAVGDSCLFVIRDDRLSFSFPMKESLEFDNNPSLVCSNPANAEDLWQEVQLHSGDCVAGDRLILTSDALACWFLSQCEVGETPWRTLLALEPSQWDDWVEEQRGAGLMRNDDTTLVIIRVN